MPPTAAATGRLPPRSTLTVDDEDNLKVGYDRVPAGEWLLGFWLEDYAGNSAFSAVPVTVK